MTPPLADRARRLAMVKTRPALGGGPLRATFPRTLEEVVAEEQPPEACLRQSLQLAPRPREAGWEDRNLVWEAGWAAAFWEVSWEVAWEVAHGVLMTLQLLAKSRATRAQHPPLRQLQLLAPPPRVFQLLPLLAPPPRVLQALPQTTQRLNQLGAATPRVVAHGWAGEGGHTCCHSIWQCTGRVRKRANASIVHRRAMPTQRRPTRGESGLLERIAI